MASCGSGLPSGTRLMHPGTLRPFDFSFIRLEDKDRFMGASSLGRPLAIAVLLAAALSPAACKVDPSTGVIRIVCIGESYYPETRLPLILSSDPRIRYQPIPANWYEGTFASVGSGSRSDVLKFMRQYMPRTYQRLVDTYDEILLSDFEVDVITEEQFVWMERSVREDGMGLGKYEMNYDPGHFSTFGRFVASAIYDALPADLEEGKLIPKPLDGIYPVDLPGTGKPHPMFDLPGMSNYKVLASGDYGYETPRPGSTVVAKFLPKNEDAIIVWEYGEGRSLACLPGHDKIDGNSLTMWPYSVDFWVNQMWYLAGIPIPEEVELVHNLRESSLNYVNERSLSASVIEFVEKFGAPTRKLYQQLADVDDIKRQSDRLYMEERYVESLEKLDEAFASLKQLSDDSVRVKDQALLWIYMIEWFTVTGTLVLTGFILWSLMVRRRLYREVEITRAR